MIPSICFIVLLEESEEGRAPNLDSLWGQMILQHDGGISQLHLQRADVTRPSRTCDCPYGRAASQRGRRHRGILRTPPRMDVRAGDRHVHAGSQVCWGTEDQRFNITSMINTVPQEKGTVETCRKGTYGDRKEPFRADSSLLSQMKWLCPSPTYD